MEDESGGRDVDYYYVLLGNGDKKGGDLLVLVCGDCAANSVPEDATCAECVGESVIAARVSQTVSESYLSSGRARHWTCQKYRLNSFFHRFSTSCSESEFFCTGRYGIVSMTERAVHPGFPPST